MQIRITCRAKLNGKRKWYESQGVKSSFAECLKVPYTDRNEKSSSYAGQYNLLLGGQAL